jgi:hypothetical protein
MMHACCCCSTARPSWPADARCSMHAHPPPQRRRHHPAA